MGTLISGLSRHSPAGLNEVHHTGKSMKHLQTPAGSPIRRDLIDPRSSSGLATPLRKPLLTDTRSTQRG